MTENTSKESQMRNVKLEFPNFNGQNVLEWIFKAEQFFDYYKVPEAEKLTVAEMHLDQVINPWFEMSQPFLTWSDMSDALECDFGPICACASLIKL